MYNMILMIYYASYFKGFINFYKKEKNCKLVL